MEKTGGSGTERAERNTRETGFEMKYFAASDEKMRRFYFILLGNTVSAEKIFHQHSFLSFQLQIEDVDVSICTGKF